MTQENRFNLIDEPWIPIADAGRVSLRQVFSDSTYRALGGNPVQKIALTKLLLAIAQAACTPQDDQEWAELGPTGVAKKCLTYLEQWHDRFWLYGEKPFLQMPSIVQAKKQPFGAVLPDVATGNTTILLQSNVQQDLSNAECALLLVVLMSFSLGGKKTDNSVVLSKDYPGKNNEKGKPKTGGPGTSLGFMGFLHSFLIAETLLGTLWLNLFTHEQVQSLSVYPQGIGEAPWQNMPEGEACPVAKQLQESLMGRLIPISRFCLLADGELHYSEGIVHPSYKDGVVDPTVAVDHSKNNPKVLWVDPEKRPWRQLTALLSFIKQSDSFGFDCYQIRCGVVRARENKVKSFGIWSGGLRVSSNAGEQYVSGFDDFVESSVFFDSKWIGEEWYTRLEGEMSALDDVSKKVYATTLSFFRDQNMEGKKRAAKASNLFWQLSEHQFQNLVNACDNSEQAILLRKRLRKTFANAAQKSYDTFCPKSTARQLDAWAKNRPDLRHYLSR